MRLLVIRHAIAEEREDFASTRQNDELRPLTEEGRRKMARGARGLRRLAPEIDVLASSPLVRAMQTAEIVAAAYGNLVVVETEHLAPGGDPERLLDWAVGCDVATIALVGHEPDLSRFVSWLISGAPTTLVDLKKGAACLVDIEDATRRPPKAMLLWALAPAHLRQLRE